MPNPNQGDAPQDLHERVGSLEDWREDTDKIVRDLRARAEKTDAIVRKLDASIERMEGQMRTLATRADIASLASQFNGVPMRYFIASLVLICLSSIIAMAVR